MNSIVRPKFSPYTFARVAAMRSKLLQKSDYDKLLKMGYNESLRFLQDSEYRQEIDEFDVSLQGLKVIEEALNANLMKTFSKLHRVSEEGLRDVIKRYLLRYDRENVKIIVRSKFARIPAEDVEPLLYYTPNYTEEFWKNVLAKENVADILEIFFFARGKDVPVDKLFEIENTLDGHYVELMNDLANRLRGEGNVMKEFLMKEIETMNINTVLRFHREENQELEKFLIFPSKFVLKLAKMTDTESIIKELNTVMGITGNDLAEVELELQKLLLRKQLRLMHKYLLSANSLLGFLFAKEIEVRNLKVIIKGKKLELEQDYIEKLLVVSR